MYPAVKNYLFGEIYVCDSVKKSPSVEKLFPVRNYPTLKFMLQTMPPTVSHTPPTRE